MTLSIVILALVTAQRLGELVLARRNTARLLAQGGVERAAAHYPLIVVLHAAWLAASGCWRGTGRRTWRGSPPIWSCKA